MELPVDIVYWLLALVPIALLLVLLAVLRWQAPQAGPVYRMGTAAGAFTALRIGIERLSRDSTFLVLAFGWVLASFLQGGLVRPPDRARRLTVRPGDGVGPRTVPPRRLHG